MRKRSGIGLIETLTSFCILGLVVPAFLGAFGGMFLAGVRITENAEKASCAEWWFNRLEPPVSRTALEDMPRTDPGGKIRYEWDVADEEDDALRITLRVARGTFFEHPFVMSRVY